MKTLGMTKRLCLTLGLGLSLVALSGCTGKVTGSANVNEQEMVIPDFPDAQRQFAFAKAYQGSLLIAPELKRRRDQMAKVAQCYNKVISNFPNDTNYVSLTYLELGDCSAQSDDMAGAISYYQKAAQVSQEDFIQARSQFSIGRIYNMQEKYVEAKAIFKGIMDTYGNTQSARVKDVVQRSAQLYYQVVDPSEKKAMQEAVVKKKR